ncbi:MAG: hypothetical protein ACOCV8_00860 [Spirochaetota bacterium]
MAPINIEEKILINSKLIMKLKNQSKIVDKQIAIYSDLKERPFSSYKKEKHPYFKDEVVVMRTKDNVAQLTISKQNTILTYNYHPTYQMNTKGSLALFTDLAERVFHSIIDIVKDVSDIEVVGCVNYIHIPTPSQSPSQLLFDQFVNIKDIDKINTFSLNFSEERDNSFFINYSFNKYEQKVLTEKPNNPSKPTKEELKKAVKKGEGIQLIVDINNKPSLREGKEPFDKDSITKLLIFVRETILNIDKIFKQ